jgi:methionyl-tRNA synthetase
VLKKPTITMSNRFYITTPIYYVNAEPHLGHAYSTVIADIFARYHRLFGDDTFFLTGTDEHGQKVEEAAHSAGRTPLEHCDLMVQRFQTVWEKLAISHDDFIRTTEKRHADLVQEILQKLWDAEEIYEDEYEGWYCVPEERFWTEKDLDEGNCPSCGREVRRLTEKNYFFRMGKYQNWLIDYIREHPRFILPESRRNEILGFLSNPLGDLCISRPVERLSWGIPLPFDEKFVTYVWFDALLNYVSSPVSKKTDWWPASVHLIGKDILTTHAVYWPTMLKAAGMALPQTIFATGWWLAEKAKMSKSIGNVVEPLAMADKYGMDAFRFFLAREMSLGMDASFSEAALVSRYNSELANDLGNLYSRLLKLIQTFCAGQIPAGKPDNGAFPELSDQAITDLRASVRDLIEQLRLNAALDAIMAFVREINRAIEVAKPWKTGKSDPEGTAEFLRLALNALANATCLFHPVMPGKMGELLQNLGLASTERPCLTENLVIPEGQPLPAKASLFPRVKLDIPEETPLEPEAEMNRISFEEFKRLQLKVARIVSAEPAPNADKLLVLTVDLGSEERTLIAGVAQQYKPDDLIGKLVVVVANLEPARIRGIESNGMVLAAEDGGELALIIPEKEMAPGSSVS